MKMRIVATAAILALSTGLAAAEGSGVAPGKNTQLGPAQEGGRTGASPGPSAPYGAATMTPSDPRPNMSSGLAPGQDPHQGAAQEAGRTHATPGPGTYDPAEVTGSITPRSGVAPGHDPHKGPAQEGGRTSATPAPLMQ